MKRFEYARVYMESLNDAETIDQFDIMGAAGWELVSIVDRILPNITPKVRKQVAYFKREIIEPKNA